MTKDGWIKCVEDSKNIPEQQALLAQLCYEQEAAKNRLRGLGFGWSGLDWDGTVDEIERQMK
jgi:hypothetical protein